MAAAPGAGGQGGRGMNDALQHRWQHHHYHGGRLDGYWATDSGEAMKARRRVSTRLRRATDRWPHEAATCDCEHPTCDAARISLPCGTRPPGFSLVPHTTPRRLVDIWSVGCIFDCNRAGGSKPVYASCWALNLRPGLCDHLSTTPPIDNIVWWLSWTLLLVVHGGANSCMTAVLCDGVRDVLGKNATVWLAPFRCAASVPLVLFLYLTLKMLQIQDPTRQVHCCRFHQEPLEVCLCFGGLLSVPYKHHS